jgi:hypothetical protein
VRVSPPNFDARQRALVEALSQKDDRLAEMYIGALVTLDNPDNPDGIEQACHSLRELMEKIPKWYAELPTAEQLPRMGDKVRSLAVKWGRTRKKSKCVNGATWTGVIDQVLQKTLMEIDTFFAWFEEDFPSRKSRTAGMLRKIDPMGLPLPVQIKELRVTEWSLCRDYFIAVAHHNTDATSQEVKKWIYVLENFLLDLFRPRTFEKHSQIDAIVEQGERNAKP